MNPPVVYQAPAPEAYWKRCDNHHEAIMLPKHMCVIVMVADNTMVQDKRCDIIYAHGNARDVTADYRERGWLVQRLGNVVRLVRRPL